jgi:photosystem II stability/assembly factor-like uncharacterized protein
MKKNYLFSSLLFATCLQVSAQWTPTASPFGSGSPYGVRNMSVPDAQTVWVSARNSSGSGPNNNWARTTNGGQSWTTGTTGNNTSTFSISSISAFNADTAFMTLASSGGRLVRTNNGGATWTNVLPAAFAAPDGYPNFVHFFDRQHGIVAGDPVGINPDWEVYTTSDGGQNWTLLPVANIPAPLPSEAGTTNRYYALNNHIWFITNKGRVFHSADRGLHFTASSIGTPAAHHTSFLDSLNGFASVLGNVKKSVDGGQTWTQATVAGPMHYYWYERIPGTNAMISTGLNANNNDVGSSYSPDNGQSWVSIETQIPGTMVRFYDNATGYLASTANGSQAFYKWGGSPFQPITSLTENLTAGEVEVWPNPGQDLFHLRLPQGTGSLTGSVTDALGRLVLPLTFAADNQAVSVNLKDQPMGFYSVVLHNAEGQVYRFRLLKK